MFQYDIYLDFSGLGNHITFISMLKTNIFNIIKENNNGTRDEF